MYPVVGARDGYFTVLDPWGGDGRLPGQPKPADAAEGDGKAEFTVSAPDLFTQFSSVYIWCGGRHHRAFAVPQRTRLPRSALSCRMGPVSVLTLAALSRPCSRCDPTWLYKSTRAEVAKGRPAAFEARGSPLFACVLQPAVLPQTSLRLASD